MHAAMDVDNEMDKQRSRIAFEQTDHDNFSAIDWIFEYSKERRRQQLISAQAVGLVGRVTQVIDASKVWVILLVTGIACGVLAGSIDVISDWLSDLKSGFCDSNNGDGRFYLNKSFCCWGYNGKVYPFFPTRVIS